MSGALISLVSRGAQDVYLVNNESENSFFKSKFTRYTNFAQAPKMLEMSGNIKNNGITSIFIKSFGDLINNVWLEGSDIVFNIQGAIFELYIGGQKIDSQTFDFMADVWQIYMAESYTKCQTINNNVSQSNTNFFPLHFFFCDNEMFLPLVALQYHQVEIRITWGPDIEGVGDVVAYGNYIFLDTSERQTFVSKEQIDMIITQVQSVQGSSSSIDMSSLNHPVKSIYFGYPQAATGYWTFDSASIVLNGTPLLENMTPTYFHTVQGYYHTKYGIINLNMQTYSPEYTQYFMYNFCLDTTSYKPTGACNFSRLDTSRINFNNANLTNAGVTNLNLYAVNYNILKIENGMGGMMYAN
jgi:hypothetical protein